MKIFISWSGQQSHASAVALRDWLPNIFEKIEIFVSSEDIRKGKRWRQEIVKELDATNFGIVCLTPDNLEAPWLLFESGALSKSLKEGTVYTLLLGGLRSTNVNGPLSEFQHTLFEKDDFYKLILAINETLADNKREPTRLKMVFDKFWDDLNKTVSDAVKSVTSKGKQRTSDEMLEEMLEIVRQLAKNMPATNPNPIPELSIEPSSKDFWPRFLQILRTEHPFLSTYLSEARGYLENQTLTVLFPPRIEHYIGVVNHSKNIANLENVLMKRGFGPCKVVLKTLQDVAHA